MNDGSHIWGWFRGKAVQGANCYHDAAITHERRWHDGRGRFRAPMAYAPDQWVVLTFTGVNATTNETSLSLSNLTYKGQAPVAYDTGAGWVSYVVPMPGGSAQAFGPDDFAWPSTGEVHAWDTWEYG